MKNRCTLIPRDTNIHNFYSVVFVENITGKKPSGYKLSTTIALGIALLIGCLAFFVELLLQLFVFNEPEVNMVILNSTISFLKYFVCVFVITFVICILSDWKARIIKSTTKNRGIVNFTVTSITVIITSIVSYFSYSLLDKFQTNKAGFSLESCKELNTDTNCEKLISDLSFDTKFKKEKVNNTHPDKKIGSPSNKHLEKLYDNLIKNGKISPEEFDKLFEEIGFTDFSVVDRLGRMTRSFENITLFGKPNKIDWDEFLNELDETNSVNAQLMTYNAIIDRAPFDVL